ncbi:MAG: pyruvate carboxylase [Alphaproteobacteria bacterium]|nr:pyruvate carboxylase [Alphaproteobacteria bacterium]
MRHRQGQIRKIVIANRGEIAIRVMRAASELGIQTVAIYSQEDRFSLHRFKADESYLVGQGKKPVDAYLDIHDIIRIAHQTGAQAIHPGYGFLAENPDFAEACAAGGLTFIGPLPETMRALGNKVLAREMAIKAGIPVMPATDPLPYDDAEVLKLGEKVGYPVMIKASWGGGGRGMRVIDRAEILVENVAAARREAKAAFGNDEVYLEKLVKKARHVEVQILGDAHGNVVHFYERDCTVQRRHQKVVERAPAPYFDQSQRDELTGYALKLARTANYRNAGTVEFLQDADTKAFYFIEVNPRIQVEHTVTECITGFDLIRAQILVAEGMRIGEPGSGLPRQQDIPLNGHALQCRVTAEDPEKDFAPDYGSITNYRSAAGFGIRLDAGTAYSGARITRYYDSLLVKVTAWAQEPADAIFRMDRALREFRVRGVKTNLRFLENVVNHPHFLEGDYTTTFIDDTPELFHFQKRRDRATRLLNFVGEVMVNGNPETKGRETPKSFAAPHVPELPDAPPPAGTREMFKKLGAKGFAQWMRDQKRVLITDTTMRDAHQSLLATRMRSHDMYAIAPTYAHLLPGLLSLECWGGATFDVAMRFLKEDPWERLRELRTLAPNILTQMLLRSANGVGYTNYPDNVVKFFVKRSAEEGMDLFRVFDSLNWVENMRVAIDAVCESGKLCEAAICYTGDIQDPKRAKYDLKYYVGMAKELEKAGAHILGIKDMAGLLKPAAAKVLVKALREEIGLPIHFHTHDTSGIAAASILSAIDAGVDAVDAAMDAMSGTTSQPCLGSIVEALRGTERDSGLSSESIRTVSAYWEQVRKNYGAFEAHQTTGASEVYLHEMPGGQFTNLKEQARSMGLEKHWPDIAKAYADVNHLFGDIVKVTPSSKVVGDMALMMVTNSLTAEMVADPERDIAFPDSVVSFFRGDMGQPVGGFPADLQKKVLKGEKPLTKRPGEVLPAVDLDKTKAEIEQKLGRQISDDELASYLMYPKVFMDYAEHLKLYGDVSVLPTPVFFHGMIPDQEISIYVGPGRALIVRYLTKSEADEAGEATVFFELNGQPRSVRVADRTRTPIKQARPKATENNPLEVGAPMPGTVVSVAVTKGQKVARGDILLAVEAMKMETAVRAECDGVVHKIHVHSGDAVDAKDLLVTMQAEGA